MIFVDDLMRGLVALQEADEAGLNEPQNGYCIPGLSFTPNELFAEIRKHHPGFGFRVELDENMNKFANLWPDELSSKEAKLDLGYEPKVGLTDMVANVLFGHETRNELTAKAFKAMDIGKNGREANERWGKEVDCLTHILTNLHDLFGLSLRSPPQNKTVSSTDWRSSTTSRSTTWQLEGRTTPTEGSERTLSLISS
jgi:hypothetical protein